MPTLFKLVLILPLAILACTNKVKDTEHIQDENTPFYNKVPVRTYDSIPLTNSQLELFKEIAKMEFDSIMKMIPTVSPEINSEFVEFNDIIVPVTAPKVRGSNWVFWAHLTDSSGISVKYHENVKDNVSKVLSNRDSIELYKDGSIYSGFAYTTGKNRAQEFFYIKDGIIIMEGSYGESLSAIEMEIHHGDYERLIDPEWTAKERPGLIFSLLMFQTDFQSGENIFFLNDESSGKVWAKRYRHYIEENKYIQLEYHDKYSSAANHLFKASICVNTLNEYQKTSRDKTKWEFRHGIEKTFDEDLALKSIRTYYFEKELDCIGDCE